MVTCLYDQQTIDRKDRQKAALRGVITKMKKQIKELKKAVEKK